MYLEGDCSSTFLGAPVHSFLEPELNLEPFEKEFAAPHASAPLASSPSRLITVDVDVEFHVDPAQLYRQFDHFSAEAVVGAANDLAPHYHQMLTGYRELHPDTELGMPGPFQGLNVGVLLLELDRFLLALLFIIY